MRKTHFIIILLCLFVASASAQKLPKPTQLAVVATPDQEKMILVGNRLHDQKKFDEAIVVYDKLLAETPNLTMALYEKALSLYTKGDKTKAMETAYLGAKFISEELPLFYSIMANCLDDVGKPDEALNIYRQAEAILKADVATQRFLSSVYYNVAVTYVGQKKYNEARAELKKAIENNGSYASPHYLLSVVYNGTKYKVPAFLAAIRFISLELNTARSQAAAGIISDMLKPADKDPKTGNIIINLDFFAPKDEGDFGMYELLMGTLTTIKTDKDKGKTDDEMFVSAIGTMISMIAEDKKLKDTFVGKHYVPFVAELKQKGYSEILGYTILYLSGKPDAMKWLEAHDAKFGEFIAWTKAYQPPK